MIKNLAIWAFAIAIAAISGVTALGAVTKNKAPSLAISLQPVNGFSENEIAIQLTQNAIQENQNQFPSAIEPRTYDLAIRAFTAEPITPGAIAVIALAKSGGVRHDLMEQAFELSRRQQIVTGWMITDSARRNDVAALLNFYDISLRTEPKSGQQFIPAMARAMAIPDFIEPMFKMLNTDPPWAGRFWRQLVRTPPSLVNGAILRTKLGTGPGKSTQNHDEQLLQALIKNGSFIDARNLYRIFAQAQDSLELVRNPDFDQNSKYPPFDWQLFSNGEFGAVIESGALWLNAVKGSGGVFARQLIELPADRGRLQLTGKLATPLQAGDKLSLRIYCAESNKKNNLSARIPFEGPEIRREIINPNLDCRFFWLDIVAEAESNDGDFDLKFENLSIR